MNANRQSDEPTAPPALADALRKLPVERISIPPYVDRAVLAAAERHLADPPRRQNRARLLWPAFAALTVLIAWLGIVVVSHNSTRRIPAPMAREDFNRDGRVDVLDAFALAREVRDQQTISTRFDLNNDGVIDRRDVEVIAEKAVEMEQDRPS